MVRKDLESLPTPSPARKQNLLHVRNRKNCISWPCYIGSIIYSLFLRSVHFLHFHLWTTVLVSDAYRQRHFIAKPSIFSPGNRDVLKQMLTLLLIGTCNAMIGASR